MADDCTPTLPAEELIRGIKIISAGAVFIIVWKSVMMRKQMGELDMPPVDEFLEMITAGGGSIYACKLAVDMFKLKKEDLSDEVNSIITIGQFYELCDGDRTQIIFT